MTLRSLHSVPRANAPDHKPSIVSGRLPPPDVEAEAAAGINANREPDAARIGGGLVLGVRPLGVDDLFAPLPPVEFLSKDLQWCAGRPAIIVGARGSGKTTAILSAALSLASGTRPIWNHFPVGRRAHVLHLDHDHGTRATQRRYQRLALGMGLSWEELRGYLCFLPGPKIRLADPRARDLCRRAVDGFDLCVLDPLCDVLVGADASDARIRDGFDRVLTPVSEDTGCAFVVLHHMSEGGAQEPDNEAGRGRARILGGSGSQLRFALTTGGAAPELRRLTMTNEGAGMDLAPFYLDFEDVPENAVNLEAGVRVVYRAGAQSKPAGRGAAARDQVLSYVRAWTFAHEPVRGIEALAKAIHVHRRTVSEAVAELEREKLLVNEPERIGHGAPKPRPWACSAADFTRPPCPAPDARPAS